MIVCRAMGVCVPAHNIMQYQKEGEKIEGIYQMFVYANRMENHPNPDDDDCALHDRYNSQVLWLFHLLQEYNVQFNCLISFHSHLA